LTYFIGVVANHHFEVFGESPLLKQKTWKFGGKIAIYPDHHKNNMSAEVQ
jgi:hypothetical protein